MPAEVLVAETAAMAKTEAWAESYSNTVSLTKSVSGSLANVYNSYEVSNGGSNGNFESSELSMKCSKCMCHHTECQCEQFVECLSHQLGPAYCPNPNDCELVPRRCSLL
jgi:hypothetical protein